MTSGKIEGKEGKVYWRSRENTGYTEREERATEVTRAEIPENNSEFYFIQNPESMQHIDLKRSQMQQISQPTIGKT